MVVATEPDSTFSVRARAARKTRAAFSQPDRIARAPIARAFDARSTISSQRTASSRFPGVRWSIDVDPYDMF